MLERFIDQTSFTSQEDFIKHFKIKVPENFNFGYDVVDKIASVRVNRMDKPLDDQRIKSMSVETFGVEYPEVEKM